MTEEEALTTGGAEWERETRMATEWGIQESCAELLHGETQDGGGKTGKAPSANVDEEGAW